MEDLQVEDFNDPIEHKAEQTADGIKTPENQENDEEQTSIFKEIMSWVIPFAIALVAALLIKNFLIINVKIHSHDVAAFCITNGTDTAWILNLSNVSWVVKMIHYFFTIHTFYPAFFEYNLLF